MSDATLTQPTFAYPQDFVSRVKEKFPNKVPLHAALDKNLINVGDHLRNMGEHIPFQSIIFLIDSGQIARLKEEAKQALAARELLTEWSEITGERPYIG